MKHLRRIGKILLWTALVLVLLSLVAAWAVRRPSVQAWLVGKATSFLSEKLNTTVTVDGVAIDFFKTAVLEGIYVADRQGDTLLFARRLAVDIGVFSLLRSEIFLNKVELHGAVAHLYRLADDRDFNYQFMLDALAGDTPADTSAGKPWAFGLGELALNDLRFRMADEGEGRFVLNTDITALHVVAERLDFEKQEIALKSLLLKNSDMAFRQLEREQVVQTVTEPGPLQFPGIGWTIAARRIDLENNRIVFSDDNAPRLDNALDYAHLDLQETHITIRNMRFADDGIVAGIERVSFRDAGGFQLDELSGEVDVLPQKIEVKNLTVRTPQSLIKNDTHLTFNAFGDLADFMGRVRLTAAFTGTRAATDDLLLLVPALRSIENLRFPEGQFLELDGKIELAEGRLDLHGIALSAGGTTRLAASGSIAGLNSKPRFDLQIGQLATSYQSLTAFTRGIDLPPALRDFGEISLTGKVTGDLGDLTASGLDLRTQASARFAGDLHIRGLPDIEKAVFDLQINNLAARASDFQGFSESPLPSLLDSLGLVRFAGSYRGTVRDFMVAGTFLTDAGKAETGLDLHFDKNYSSARYAGRLAMENFDLGKLLGDTAQIGTVTLNTFLDGEGLTLEKLNTRMRGEVGKLEFRGYEYHNIYVDGRFAQRLFEGNLTVGDDNLCIDLLGKVNLNDSLPEFDLALAIDTINLKKLRLMEDDIGLSGKLAAALTGNSLDNLDGRAVLSNMAVTGNGGHYFDEKMELLARQTGSGTRALFFDAAFMKARVEGRYNFGDLPGLVLNYVSDFFPVEGFTAPSDSTAKQRGELADQQFGFDFRFTDLAALAHIFLPEIGAVDSTAYLQGSFDSAEKNLELTGAFPNVVYQGNRFDTLLISMNGNRRRLRTSARLHNLNLGGAFRAPMLDFSTRTAADTLRFDLNVLDDSLGTRFKWGGRSTEVADRYMVKMDTAMVLNREVWAVDENNAVYFSREDASVHDLVFSKSGQSVSVRSLGEAPPGDLAPLELRFNRFRLGEIAALLADPDLRPGGLLDGHFTIKEPRQNLHYHAGIHAEGLSLNDTLIGDLRIEASQAAGQQAVAISTVLTGPNALEIKGTYSLPDRRFDVRADIGKLHTALADPFLKELIRNSEGHLTGHFILKGTPDEPLLTGRITPQGTGTEVVLSGTHYRIDGGEIVFSENEIELGALRLLDANGRTANLGGRVGHRFFREVNLDLRAQTDALQILNTAREDNPLYYGRLFARADVHITGTPELPRLRIVAATVENSLLNVEPLTASFNVAQEDYIIFANPASYEPDSLRLLEQKIGAGRGGMDLDIMLQITPQARMHIIIDPLTGDELFCTGSGNFNIRMNPAGDLGISGTFVIEEGHYAFNYEGLVKRRFELRKGSSLRFSGDPYNARFDITAVYKTRATTYELIGNEATLADEALAASKRRTDVEVLMKIAGSLNEPELSFDIALPGSRGGPVDNLIARKLADLRDDPTELNKQVFGLLFFNSFIQAETGAGLAGVGENAALKSVSGLITGQLNRLADRYVRGVDLTLGFESYRAAGQSDATVTELQVGLSKQLFNDRLTISVGGNFNLENSGPSTVQQGGQSAVAGDFVLEYKLNERGSYLFKVFHKSDYNVLLDANTNRTGVGLMYRKSY